MPERDPSVISGPLANTSVTVATGLLLPAAARTEESPPIIDRVRPGIVDVGIVA